MIDSAHIYQLQNEWEEPCDGSKRRERPVLWARFHVLTSHTTSSSSTSMSQQISQCRVKYDTCSAGMSLCGLCAVTLCAFEAFGERRLGELAARATASSLIIAALVASVSNASFMPHSKLLHCANESRWFAVKP